MYIKKELTRIFGNITYVISTGLKSEPKLVTLTEEPPCQLFYFPKIANNLLLCLYLDGIDRESLILSIYCVRPEEIDRVIPKQFLGDDFNYRKPNMIVQKQVIPLEVPSIYTWTIEDIISVIGSNKAFIRQLKHILKNHKYYGNLQQVFDFVPNDIDIKLK